MGGFKGLKISFLYRIFDSGVLYNSIIYVNLHCFHEGFSGMVLIGKSIETLSERRILGTV